MSDASPKPRGRGRWWLLGGLVVVLLCCVPVGACVTFGGGLFATVTSALRSTEAFDVAVQAAKDDPTVQQALGTPVESGWFVVGNVSTSGGSGTTTLTVPLNGPEGSATLYVEAHKSAGQWTFDVAEVALEDGRRVDLRAALP